MGRWMMVALGVIACGDGTTVEDQQDPGSACLVGDAADIQVVDVFRPTVIEAGESAEIVVIVSECSSGSIQWDNACTATLDGSTISVSATSSATIPETQTTDCQLVTVVCPVGVLEAGTYDLVYGGVTVDVTVPYDGEAVCVEAPALVPPEPL